MDREKVIKGLECIRDWAQFTVNHGWIVGGASEKMVKYAEDALALLKAQGERETTSSVSPKESGRRPHPSAPGALTPSPEGKAREAQGAVVRCRECRHCRLLNDGVSFECKELEMDFYAPQYDAATYYCADGERRDGA